MSHAKYHPYPNYKPSGIPWIGNIPDEWDIQELRYLADVRFSSVDKKSYEGQNTVYLCNYTDVYYQTYITANLEFMQATASEDEIARFELKAGDVLITKDSESWDDIAIPAYVPNDLPNVICGYHLAMIRSKHILGAYLFWCFMSRAVAYQFNISANGITRFGLSQQDIKDAIFPVPSLDEQRTIAAFLDRETAKIDTLVAKKQRFLELLTEKHQALITHAVTKGLDPHAPMKDSGVATYWFSKTPSSWSIAPVIYYTRLLTGGTPDRQNRDYWEDGSIAWMASGEVNKKFVYETDEKITPLGMEKSNARLLPINSVMMALNGQGKRLGLAAISL
jgi:type I restriction enzyme, S subunit